MQRNVRAFVERNHLACGAQSRYVDLVSEVGELGKEILKSTDYGKAAFQVTDTAKDEIGDCLFSLLALCCEMNIDAEAALQSALNKYRRRFETTGTAGSGR